jgi:predicted transcriptional regulator
VSRGLGRGFDSWASVGALGALRRDALCRRSRRIMEAQINVRLDRPLRERLEELARAEDRPLSYHVRSVLANWVAWNSRNAEARRAQEGQAA